MKKARRASTASMLVASRALSTQSFNDILIFCYCLVIAMTLRPTYDISLRCFFGVVEKPAPADQEVIRPRRKFGNWHCTMFYLGFHIYAI